MITEHQFFQALHTLCEVLPYSKQLSPESKAALWDMFPERAKRDLSPGDLRWAMEQRLLDPDPPREMAMSTVFLHYCYPKRDGWPALDAGPRRRDPREPMRDDRRVFRAGADGEPVPALPMQQEAKQLPGSGQVLDCDANWAGGFFVYGARQ
jgi:hypothetical protein